VGLVRSVILLVLAAATCTVEGDPPKPKDCGNCWGDTASAIMNHGPKNDDGKCVMCGDSY